MPQSTDIKAMNTEIEKLTEKIMENEARLLVPGFRAGVKNMEIFLFIILMTKLMNDAKNDLRQNSSEHLDTFGFANELLYADDTLFTDTHGGVAQKYMDRGVGNTVC